MAETLYSLIENDIPEGKQALNNYSNKFEELAAYCKDNFDKAPSKSNALEETKCLVAQALSTIASQLYYMATNFNQMVDIQFILVKEMESNVNHLAQRIEIIREKIYRREIGQLTTNQVITRNYKIVTNKLSEAQQMQKYVRRPINYNAFDNIGNCPLLRPVTNTMAPNHSKQVNPDDNALNVQTGNLYGSRNSRYNSTSSNSPKSSITSKQPPTNFTIYGHMKNSLLSSHLHLAQQKLQPFDSSNLSGTLHHNFSRMALNHPMPSLNNNNFAQMNSEFFNPNRRDMMRTTTLPLNATSNFMSKHDPQAPPPFSSMFNNNDNCFDPNNPSLNNFQLQQQQGAMNLYDPGAKSDFYQTNAMYNSNNMMANIQPSLNPLSSTSCNISGIDRILNPGDLYQPLTHLKSGLDYPFHSSGLSPHTANLSSASVSHNTETNFYQPSFNNVCNVDNGNNLPPENIYADRNIVESHGKYIEKVVALYDYTMEKEDELTFKENDLIIVVKKNEDGWWEGILNGKRGLFPGNYVESI